MWEKIVDWLGGSLLVYGNSYKYKIYVIFFDDRDADLERKVEWTSKRNVNDAKRNVNDARRNVNSEKQAKIQHFKQNIQIS